MHLRLQRIPRNQETRLCTTPSNPEQQFPPHHMWVHNRKIPITVVVRTKTYQPFPWLSLRIRECSNILAVPVTGPYDSQDPYDSRVYQDSSAYQAPAVTQTQAAPAASNSSSRREREPERERDRHRHSRR